MRIRDALLLSIFPILLLCVAAFLGLSKETPFLTTNESSSHIAKIEKIITGIETGKIKPSDQQFIELLKSHGQAEKARGEYDDSMRRLFNKLTSLIAANGIFQLGIVFCIYRRTKKNHI